MVKINEDGLLAGDLQLGLLIQERDEPEGLEPEPSITRISLLCWQVEIMSGTDSIHSLRCLRDKRQGVEFECNPRPTKDESDRTEETTALGPTKEPP